MRRANLSRVEPSSKGKAVVLLLSSFAAILLAIPNAAAVDATANPAPANARVEPGPSQELVISIPDRKLALLEDGKLVKLYSVAVGASRTPSPTGQFKIINRLVRPTYYHKGHVIKPGRSNPLGNRWIGLDLKGYGIHGTNEPRSIGHAASHGCIRMAKKDVEDLFRQVHVGDEVTIYDELPSQLASVFESPGDSDTPMNLAGGSEQQASPLKSESGGSL